MTDERVEEPGVPASPEDETRPALWNRIYSVLGMVNKGNRSSWADELETLFNAELEEAVTNARNNGREELSTTKLAYAKEIDTLEKGLADMTANFHETQNEVAKIQERYEVKCKELDASEFEVGELKARITEMEAEAKEDRKIKQKMDADIRLANEQGDTRAKLLTEGYEKELSETRAIYARQTMELEIAKRDAAHFRTRTATAEEHARKLYDVIESLAAIGRNL